MSTIEIALLWCVVSYAIAGVVVRWQGEKIDDIVASFFVLSPIMVPALVCFAAVLYSMRWLMVAVSKRRGKNENES